MTDELPARRRQPTQTRTDVASRGTPGATVERRREQINQVGRIVQEQAGVLRRLLPEHLTVETFVSLAGAALYRNADLLDAAYANPDSFMIALRECAGLGHMPGTKQYWLIPRPEKGRLRVAGQEGYHGLMERMYRSGGAWSIRCDIVHQEDTYIRGGDVAGIPRHDITGGPFVPRDQRGEMIGVYAYAILPGGVASQVIEMPMEEVWERRAMAGFDAVWRKWPRPMIRKTALLRLEPYVPTSAAYLTRAAAVAAQIAQVAPTQLPPGTEAPPLPDPTGGGVGEGGPGSGEGGVIDGEPVTGVDPAAWSEAVAMPGEGVPFDAEDDR